MNIQYIDSRKLPFKTLDISKLSLNIVSFCIYLCDNCFFECDSITIVKRDKIDRDFAFRSKYNIRTIHFFLNGKEINSIQFDSLESMLKFKYYSL